MEESQYRFLLILFTLLNIINGLTVGFFDYLPLIWTNAKSSRSVSFSALSLYSFIAYPHLFKIFIAPLTEIYYIPLLGKRKTYIMISQISLLILMLVLLPFANKLINDINVPIMLIFGLIANFMAALQEIAVSGLTVTMFPEQYVKQVIVWRSIGIYIGLVISGPMFLYLNSLDFCNKYLYSIEQTEPIMTPAIFLFLAIIINAIIIFLLYFFINEVEHEKLVEEQTKRKRTIITFKIMIKSLKQIYLNCNLYYLMLFLITWRFGFEVMHTSYPIQLVKAGFPKEIYALIETLAFPVNLLMPLVTGKLAKNGKEMTFFIYHFAIRFLEIVSSLIIVTTYTESNYYYYLVPIFLSMYVQRACRVAGWVNFQAFYGKIADEEIGSTYITILNSLCNIGKSQASTLILFLMQFLGFANFVIIGLIYSLIYILYFQRKIREFENLPKSAWKVVKQD